MGHVQEKEGELRQLDHSRALYFPSPRETDHERNQAACGNRLDESCITSARPSQFWMMHGSWACLFYTCPDIFLFSYTVLTLHRATQPCRQLYQNGVGRLPIVTTMYTVYSSCLHLRPIPLMPPPGIHTCSRNVNFFLQKGSQVQQRLPHNVCSNIVKI